MVLLNLTAVLFLCWCKFKFSSILIPRYLTLPVKKNIFQFNLCLYKLRGILLAFSQVERFFISRLTSLSNFLIESLKWRRLVLSAKWYTSQNLIAKFRSLKYIKKRAQGQSLEVLQILYWYYILYLYYIVYNIILYIIF